MLRTIFTIFLVLSPFLNNSSMETSKTFLRIKIFLQGPFRNHSMSEELNKEHLLPLSQPYSSAPWNYNGSEHVNKIPPDVVDWILVELNENKNRTRIIERKAAFLKTDGTITSLDGTSPLGFNKIDSKAYIIIMHRNHLPVMSDKPVKFNDTVNYDFTSNNNIGVNNCLTSLGLHVFGMISGDSDSNGEIDNADYKNIANNLLKTGYLNADLDMNGVVNILDYKKTNLNLSKKSSVPLVKNF